MTLSSSEHIVSTSEERSEITYPYNRLKTTTRTIRIPTDLAEAIERLSSARGVTFNGLVNRALKRYVTYDHFSEILNFVTLPRETLRSLIETMDEDALRTLGRETGRRIPREIVLYFFKKVSVQAFLDWVRVVCEHYGAGTLDLESTSQGTTLAIHHDLGGKWSAFFCAYLSTAASAMFGGDPEYEVGEDLVFMRFSANSVAKIDQAIGEANMDSRDELLEGLLKESE